MHTIGAPTGEQILVPVDASEDKTYFKADDRAGARQYLKEKGYVVVRGLISKSMTSAARDAWDREMKAYTGYVYRQATANPERNVMNNRGFIMNPIVNLQDLPSKDFSQLKKATLEIFSDTKVVDFLHEFLGEAPKLVQTMYFEGNSATWAHQDTYYLDSENIGTMVAGWFALERIMPGAGRFYVYPGSHTIDMKLNGGDFDIAFNHDRYKRVMRELLATKGLKCVAPSLDAGDVLFWDSRTIHGSLETNQPDFSRSSLTAHYIRKQDRLLQFQKRLRPMPATTYNGLSVQKPKDQDRAINRAILFAETRFSGPFRMAKKLAMKAVTR